MHRHHDGHQNRIVKPRPEAARRLRISIRACRFSLRQPHRGFSPTGHRRKGHRSAETQHRQGRNGEANPHQWCRYSVEETLQTCRNSVRAFPSSTATELIGIVSQPTSPGSSRGQIGDLVEAISSAPSTATDTRQGRRTP